MDDYSANFQVQVATVQLIQEARFIIDAIEKYIPDTYSADGFFKVFVAGFLPVPFLWNQDPLYRHARQWQTQFHQGGVKLVNGEGQPLTVEERVNYALSNLPETEYALKQSRR